MRQTDLHSFLKAATTCNQKKVKLKDISVPNKLQLWKYLSLVSYPHVHRDLQWYLEGTDSS